MVNFLKHFFTPNSSNNYRPKLLHPKILIVAIIFFLSAGVITSFVRQTYPTVLGISANISYDQLLAITNQDRLQAGLAPLTLNSDLSSAAAAKGQDMFSKNYWAHISPSGTTPWYFIKNSGYSYVYAGENLARGYITASDVVNAWMASPEHRANMLSSKYADVGFSVQTGNLTGEDTVLVVEMFGSKTLAGSQNVAGNSQEVVASPTPASSQPTTPTPQPVAQANVSPNISTNSAPLINASNFSSDVARTGILIFLFVLILDMVIIQRKKVLRFVGHNLDHILFFALIFSLILIVLRGHIL